MSMSKTLSAVCGAVAFGFLALPASALPISGSHGSSPTANVSGLVQTVGHHNSRRRGHGIRKFFGGGRHHRDRGHHRRNRHH